MNSVVSPSSMIVPAVFVLVSSLILSHCLNSSMQPASFLGVYCSIW